MEPAFVLYFFYHVFVFLEVFLMLQKLKEPKGMMSQEHRVSGWRIVVERAIWILPVRRFSYTLRAGAFSFWGTHQLYDQRLRSTCRVCLLAVGPFLQWGLDQDESLGRVYDLACFG